MLAPSGRFALTRVRRMLESQHWHAPVLFALLAVLHTWPLATGLSYRSRIHDDAWLNAWAVSWVARQVANDPGHLFDANMFHPHRGALAYTEPLIAPGLLAAPIHWLGGSAVLAHNVLVLLGYTLTALAVYALVRTWTGDHRAGLLSGALFAFNTVLLTRVAHVQALHAYWLPLAFIAFHRLLMHRRTRHAAWLGLCVFGAALTSGYLVIFVFFALAAAAAASAREFWLRDGLRLTLRLGAAATVTLVALLVVLRPPCAGPLPTTTRRGSDRSGDGVQQLPLVCGEASLRDLERGLLSCRAGHALPRRRGARAGRRRPHVPAFRGAARGSPDASGGCRHRWFDVSRFPYSRICLGVRLGAAAAGAAGD